MTETGYYQIKINELKEDIEKIKIIIDDLNNNFKSLKINNEETIKNFEEKISKIDIILKSIDTDNLKHQIKEMVAIASNNKLKDFLEKMDRNFQENDKKLKENFNKDLEDIKNNLGKDIIDHTNSLIERQCHIIFSLLKEIIKNNNLKNLEYVPTFLIKNAYNSKDIIIGFDFSKEVLDIEKGNGLIDHFFKKHKMQTDNEREHIIRPKVSIT